MTNDSRNQVHSRNVLELITVGNEFCVFLEEIEKYEKVYFLSYLQKVLPLLYLKGSLLPDVEVSQAEANERFVTEEQWENIYNGVKKITGKYDAFQYVDFAYKLENEKQTGSISEFLADIYQDIKDFLLLYQKGTLAARENAVYECSALFENHWGLKLLNVHKAIHILRHGRGQSGYLAGFSAN